MNKQLSLSFIAAVMIVLSGAASAQCENMVVVVRNSIYQINGLDAFCQEFNKMKADLASMKSALSAAREQNARLRKWLDVDPTRLHEASVALLPVQSQAARHTSPIR